MYTREFIRTGPKRRSGDFTMLQLVALAAVWFMITVLTIAALVQS
jgi:hypothetical protein